MTPRGRRTRGAGGASRIAAGYLRRSTDRQEQSIPDQRKAIERYASEQGVPVERWYVDDAISGAKASSRAVERREVHGARLTPNDPNDWIVIRDAHEAIVSRRVWDLARQIRAGAGRDRGSSLGPDHLRSLRRALPGRDTA